jgi:hypothetical protein
MGAFGSGVSCLKLAEAIGFDACKLLKVIHGVERQGQVTRSPVGGRAIWDEIRDAAKWSAPSEKIDIPSMALPRR